MLGNKSGVSTLILDQNPLALVTHCQGTSLQLDVKGMSKSVSLLAAVTDTANWVIKLIKHSPKRETMLSKLQENAVNHEGAEEEDEEEYVSSMGKH